MENQTVLCGGKPSRISTCSTNELSFDSDQEGLDNDEGCLKAEESKTKLFEDMSNEAKFYYSHLNQSLERIYSELEKELEPICIREQCAFPSKRISILRISGSLITERRLSMKTIH